MGGEGSHSRSAPPPTGGEGILYAVGPNSNKLSYRVKIGFIKYSKIHNKYLKL